jgi:hypothetical protein
MPPQRWGSLPADRGFVILVSAVAIGALGTVFAGAAPGVLLGIFLVAGSVAAAFAVLLRRAYLIIPVPAVAYVVAACVTGLIHDRSVDTSHTALAVGAAEWIATGFLWMASSTILVIVIAMARWIASWRGRWARSHPRRNAPPPR